MSDACALNACALNACPLNACPMCGGHDLVELYPGNFAGSADDAPAYFLAQRSAAAHGRIARCRSCHLVQTSPRFSAEQYDAIYASIPRPHEGQAGFDLAKQARFRRLTRIVREYAAPGTPLLDFGCGDGAFLAALDDSAASGFDLGPVGERCAGQSTIRTGPGTSFAQTVAAPPGGYGAITAIDVLEHLPRLGADLARLRSMLAPGGLLFASVPNIDSRIARAMGRRWTMILLEHLWYFSPATLEAMLASHGFAMVRIQPLPFDAPLGHILTRLAQTFGMRGVVAPPRLARDLMARAVLPVPAGLMLGIFRAV